MPPSTLTPGMNDAPEHAERSIICARALPLRDADVTDTLRVLPDMLGGVLDLLAQGETLRLSLFRHGPEATRPWLELAVIAPPDTPPGRGEALGLSVHEALQFTLWSPGQPMESEPLAQEAAKGLRPLRLRPEIPAGRAFPGLRLVEEEESRPGRGAAASTDVASDVERFSRLPAQAKLAVAHLAAHPGRVVVRLEMGRRKLNAAELRDIEEQMPEEPAFMLGEERGGFFHFLSRLHEAGEGRWLACDVLAEEPLSEVALHHLCRGLYGVRHGAKGIPPEDFLCPDAWFEKRMLIPVTALALLWTREAERPRACADGVIIGHTTRDLPVHLRARDRARHTHVIGATGTGKSTLLANMALQDMEAGRSVILFDPHGDLWEELRHRVPAGRREDLQLCHLGDARWPFTCNLLEGEGGDPRIERNMIANNLIMLFRNVLYRGVPEAFGPIFEYTFRAALLLLMQARGRRATLLEFERVFADEEFRSRLLRDCSDRQVKSSWKTLTDITYSDWQLNNLAPYIVSKLTQITGNPLLRPVLARRESTLKFAKIIRDGGICLINLAEGVVGERDAAFAGGVLSIRLAMAAKASALLPEGERGECFVYMDEFQNYATQSLADMVSSLRKYGVRLTLANQTLAQLEAGLDHADLVHHILGNVANKLAFRVGQKDAGIMQPWFPESASGPALTEIADHHLLARILEDGIARPPMLLRTPPPPPPPAECLPDPEPVPFPDIEDDEITDDEEREMVERAEDHARSRLMRLLERHGKTLSDLDSDDEDEDNGRDGS